MGGGGAKGRRKEEGRKEVRKEGGGEEGREGRRRWRKRERERGREGGREGFLPGNGAWVTSGRQVRERGSEEAENQLRRSGYFLGLIVLQCED